MMFNEMDYKLYTSPLQLSQITPKSKSKEMKEEKMNKIINQTTHRRKSLAELEYQLM